MLDVNTLENRLLKYKIRQMIPLVAMIILSIILIGIVFWFLNKTTDIKESPIKKIAKSVPLQESSKKTEVKEESKTVPSKEEVVKDTKPIVRTKEIAAVYEEKLILEPSMDFLHNYEYSRVKNRAPHVEVVDEQIQVIKNENEQPKSIEEKVEKKEETKTNMSNQITKSDIIEVINRFEKNKNPKLSLFVARYYYEQKNYEKAYDYALITNELDSNIEESWLLFASTLVKLNKKADAIKTLKEYIKHTKSQKAQLLLDDIKNGDFK